MQSQCSYPASMPRGLPYSAHTTYLIMPSWLSLTTYCMACHTYTSTWLSIPYGTNAIEFLNHQCPSPSHISVLATYMRVLRYQHGTNAIEILNHLCHSPSHTSMFWPHHRWVYWYTYTALMLLSFSITSALVYPAQVCSGHTIGVCIDIQARH